MQKIIIFSVIAFFSLSAMAQVERKVAVFEPAGSAEHNIKEVIRELISAVVVNTGRYTVLERQLIDRIFDENRFQAGGLVDDTQIVEMGRLMGANLAFVSSVTPLGTNYFISCKLLDVQTARIIMQETAETRQGINDLTSTVRGMVVVMLRPQSETQFATPSPTPQPAPPPSAPQSVTQQPAPRPVQQQLAPQPTQPQRVASTTPQQVSASIMLVAKGKKVYQVNSVDPLKVNDVRQLMTNRDALALYNEGIRKKNNGDGCFGLGALTFVGFMATVVEVEAISAVLGVTSVSFFVAGIIIHSDSKKLIHQSIELHNRGNSRANLEFDFGITGNGLGVVMRF